MWIVGGYHEPVLDNTPYLEARHRQGMHHSSVQIPYYLLDI